MATAPQADPIAAPPPGEADLRRDLAAAYRLVALMGWDDAIATHISVKLPGENAFLINPFGMLFEEIRPADLVKVDMDGTVLSTTPWPVNKAGFVIHSAIHMARDDARCVMHLHTADGIAVSMLEEGLLPLNQTAMLLTADMAFHDYEGVALDLDERARLQVDLGDKTLMVLRNHGTLALGPSVAEAFASMYFLETACTIQVRALGMNRPLSGVPQEVRDKVAAIGPRGGPGIAQNLLWPAMLRKLERQEPGWAA
ncbi:class II aldolase/adducin family protein [uncultured Sphingomonas sp.]|uniref:class II aldolase/adducin family protein n=1 Tax=uncultured Sphingomonas sp. TaxID=158754 RepID=UPI0035CC4BB8